VTDKDRRRLEQLFNMLGSANVNEREAARQKIDELLTKHRKTWNDVLDLLQSGGSDQWTAAYDDDRSADQAAEDAVNAGLPEAAVKAPSALDRFKSRELCCGRLTRAEISQRNLCLEASAHSASLRR
jgi:hypothetical protein